MGDRARADLDFSQEEWSLIVDFCSWRSSSESRIGWYASVLGPITLFSIYGAWTSEITAVEMAFASLLACQLWLIRRQLRIAPTFRSICNKIVAFKQPQSSPPPSQASLS